MKQIANFDAVQAQSEGESKRIVPGGYVCRITRVEDVPFDAAKGKGDYLIVEFDVAEGEFAGYYAEQFQRFGGNWGGKLYRSYAEKAQGMFKGFIEAVEKSNSGYKWNWDEKSLVGKLVGVVYGEEEYINRNGEVAVSAKPSQVRSADVIREGKYTLPKRKELDAQQKARLNTASATPVNVVLPF